jgi:hypothetical protein
MNKQNLKYNIKKDLARLQNSVLRVIAAFPSDKNWDTRHTWLAVNKLVENTELSTQEVIEFIKRSYLCAREGWFVDGKCHKNNPSCKDSEYCKQGGCSNWGHCMMRDKEETNE